MSKTEFQINIDLFSGPPELLLYVIRRHEISPLDIRIARIVDDFLEFLDVLKLLDLDMIGDFIVMASTLVELKSRMVLPQPEEVVEEADLIDETGSGLLEHLLQYKKFREAGTALEARAAEWQERYPRLHDDQPRVSKDPAADLIREVELWDLVAALSRVLKLKDVEEETSILYDDTPIAVHSERIRKRVAQHGRVAFSDFFEGENVRPRIVGIFMAILELVRHHRYRAEQPLQCSEIWILPPLPKRDMAAGTRHVPEADVDGPDGIDTLPLADEPS